MRFNIVFLLLCRHRCSGSEGEWVEMNAAHSRTRQREERKKLKDLYLFHPQRWRRHRMAMVVRIYIVFAMRECLEIHRFIPLRSLVICMANTILYTGAIRWALNTLFSTECVGWCRWNNLLYEEYSDKSAGVRISSVLIMEWLKNLHNILCSLSLLSSSS